MGAADCLILEQVGAEICADASDSDASRPDSQSARSRNVVFHETSCAG